MNPVVTVLAYMENSVDTCRGCVVDQEGSDFVWFSSNNIQEVIEKLGRLKFENMNRKLGSYEFTILVNGLDNQTAWQLNPEEEESVAEQRDELTVLIERESTALANKLQEEKKLKQEEAKKQEQIRAANQAKQEEARRLRAKLATPALEKEQKRLQELEEQGF